MISERADSVRVAYPLFQAEGGGSTPTSALQLMIYEMDLKHARRLNRLWHSVLPKTSYSSLIRSRYSVSYGAVFDGLYYGCAMWTHPVAANRMKNSDSIIELRRFAIAPDAPINTASRMLAMMIRLLKRKWPELTKAISYQAVCVHEGTIYKAAGWRPSVKSKMTIWNPRPGKPTYAPQILSDKIRWEKELK